MVVQTKFIILGNSETAESFADGFISAGNLCVGAVSLRTELLPANSRGLEVWASRKSIDYFEIADANSIEFTKIVESSSAELLLVQWPKIISEKTIELFSQGAFGTHPTCLPWGRGRHPLHWQIAMGYSKICLCVFRLTSEIDSGPIILKYHIKIEKDESILTLIKKINLSTFQCGLELSKMLRGSSSFLESQKGKISGSLWRKRTPEDIEIDCRMSCDSISRLVRSIIPPYLGAKLITEFGILTVTEALSCQFENWEFNQIGAVLAVRDTSLVMRADDGPIELFIHGDMDPRLGYCKFLRPPRYYKSQLIDGR